MESHESVDYRHIVDWCAEECTRQRSGEMSVSWMFQGWHYALQGSEFGPPSLEDILALGKIVEPRHNGYGWRRVNVQVGLEVVPTTWQQVPRQMEILVDNINKMHPEEWFFHYETVHPWRDGNGRTGSILLNWLMGTLDDPVTAPEYQKPDTQLVEA